MNGSHQRMLQCSFSCLWPMVLSFFIFFHFECLSKWRFCFAAAIEVADLMMMTGSLKQAKRNALSIGLISRTDLPLIRLSPLSVYLFMSLLFSSFFLLRPFKSLFLVLDELFCLFQLWWTTTLLASYNRGVFLLPVQWWNIYSWSFLFTIQTFFMSQLNLNHSPDSFILQLELFCFVVCALSSCRSSCAQQNCTSPERY